MNTLSTNERDEINIENDNILGDINFFDNKESNKDENEIEEEAYILNKELINLVFNYI